MNKITRSTVNEQQYSAPQMPTSGFPQSYRRYSSYMLGRIHVGGFHWTMPGDKISGRSHGECTFKRIVTPLVSPVNAMQYNVYLPLRPLDRSFKKGVTPTKLNGMSAEWGMPTVTTRYLVDKILRAYFDELDDNTPTILSTLFTAIDEVFTDKGVNSATLKDLADSLELTVDDLLWDEDELGILIHPLQALTGEGGNIVFTGMADALYLRDALLDLAEKFTSVFGTSSNPSSSISGSTLLCDFLNLWLSTLLTPFVGRYSYYGEFKYNYLRPFDFYRISRQLTKRWSTWTGFLESFDNTPQNEYPLRAMYAIWYELFRNVDLEPVSSTLPDWQEWSSTSIFDLPYGGNFFYLIYRIRSWEKDMFISSQIDDMSRHVYAPILSSLSTAGYHSGDMNNHDSSGDDATAEGNFNIKPSVYNLAYRDQLTDTDFTVECPVPTNINDILSSLDNEFKDVYGLDLNTLRQSQMLERYLKRNYLFGDEYQDRMLAHYNSRVSDMRINKPEVLSQSMDGYDMQQEVSNVSTSAGSSVGDRTATAKIKVEGNEFSTFCEEFGIIVSLVMFMPRAMYDGINPQLLMNKQIHLPLPEFAANNEEFGRKIEIAGSGLAPIGSDDGDDNRFIFGRYPAYHAWRGRVDEVGGEFLDELQDCTFRRFFGMFSDDTTPKLNYFFIHCRPNLNMFADNILYNTQLYGDLVHDCYVERVLPTPVEVI